MLGEVAVEAVEEAEEGVGEEAAEAVVLVMQVGRRRVKTATMRTAG